MDATITVCLCVLCVFGGRAGRTCGGTPRRLQQRVSDAVFQPSRIRFTMTVSVLPLGRTSAQDGSMQAVLLAACAGGCTCTEMQSRLNAALRYVPRLASAAQVLLLSCLVSAISPWHVHCCAHIVALPEVCRTLCSISPCNGSDSVCQSVQGQSTSA